MSEYYVYVYLDPRKEGIYTYDEYNFSYEPFYIGKGKGNRFKHLISNVIGEWKYPNLEKYHKVKKIFNEGFEPIIIKIYENLTEEESLIKEIELIKIIKRKCQGGVLVNITEGGEGISGYKHSKETRELLSYKQIEWLSKNKHQSLGKINSEEHRQKISQSLTGKTQSEETIEKRRQSLKGYKHTDIFKEDIKIRQKGKNNSMFKARAKYYKVIYPDGEIIKMYGTKPTIERELGLTVNTVTRLLRTKIPLTRGKFKGLLITEWDE